MVNYTPNLAKPTSDLENGATKTAREIMLKAPLTLSSTMTIVEACSLLQEHGVSGAPVVKEAGKLIGYLSEKDCIKFLMNMKYYNEEARSVEHYMSKTLMTVDAEEQVLYLAELFIKNNFQAYPVIDEDGILLGVITRSKLFSELNNLNQTTW